MKLFSGNHFRTAVLALIGANIIWGATPPIFKWALEDITPFTLAFLRFAIASLILLLFIPKNSLRIEKSDWAKVFMLAFVGIFLHISFFFLGLTLSASINAPIIASSGPIFLIIAGVVFLKEHPSQKAVLGGLVGLAGVLIIVLLPVISQQFDGSVIGNLFFMFSMLGAVFHTVLLKKMLKNYQPLTLLFWTFTLASIIFFPTFAGEAINGSLQNIGTQGLFGIVFGAVFASTIAYFLFYSAIKYLEAVEVGIFTYLDPVVTIVIAAPLLGEIPSPTYFIGAVLVFLGIYIAEGRLHYHPIHLLRRHE